VDGVAKLALIESGGSRQIAYLDGLCKLGLFSVPITRLFESIGVHV
jgi:hypothetical protein